MEFSIRGPGYETLKFTVQADATPIKQYNWTLGYACPFPLRVFGQNCSTQSNSRTTRGGNTLSASDVPEISSEITFRTLSLAEGSLL